MSDLAKLLVSFILTTVFGAIVGSVLQRLSWNHQYKSQRFDRDLDRASDTFEEVSRLLDRRLYRMRKLHWAMQDEEDADQRRKSASKQMDDYRDILYEWNDGINRILALIERSFSKELRQELDDDIGAHIRNVGERLEMVWKGAPAGSPDTDHDFNVIADKIYQYNVKMITDIQTRPSPALSRFHRKSKTGEAGRPPSAPAGDGSTTQDDSRASAHCDP